MDFNYGPEDEAFRKELRSWLDGLELTESEKERLSSVLGEIRSRVHYLVDVGLEYLTLSRAARTLSGGEAQRIALASDRASSFVYPHVLAGWRAAGAEIASASCSAR